MIPKDATHLLVVTTEGWDDTSGFFARYERDPGGAWREVEGEDSVVIGRTGMAWGVGLHGDGAPKGRTGPVKVEGDGKSPAGIFMIAEAYGIDERPPAGTTLPYARLTDGHRCVDDAAHAKYNQVFDATGQPETWASAENMLAMGEVYRWVVVVGHNTAARPKAGSCIFLHVWSGRDSTTAGCTAMPREAIEELMRWMKPGKTVFVALPAAELEALRADWGLP